MAGWLVVFFLLVTNNEQSEAASGDLETNLRRNFTLDQVSAVTAYNVTALGSQRLCAGNLTSLPAMARQRLRDAMRWACIPEFSTLIGTLAISDPAPP